MLNACLSILLNAKVYWTGDTDNDFWENMVLLKLLNLAGGHSLDYTQKKIIYEYYCMVRINLLYPYVYMLYAHRPSSNMQEMMLIT